MKTMHLFRFSPVLLFLVLIPQSRADPPNQTHFTVRVTDSVTQTANETYGASVVVGGILLGGLRRLQESNEGFTFTYTEDPNHGPFLVSVNGLAGSSENRTYWELLVTTPGSGTRRLDVGMGCYLPNETDTVILKYNNY